MVHALNGAHANNAKILIPSIAVTSIKAVLFKLKDREQCNTLPNAAVLNAIDANQVRIMGRN